MLNGVFQLTLYGCTQWNYRLYKSGTLMSRAVYVIPYVIPPVVMLFFPNSIVLWIVANYKPHVKTVSLYYAFASSPLSIILYTCLQVTSRNFSILLKSIFNCFPLSSCSTCSSVSSTDFRKNKHNSLSSVFSVLKHWIAPNAGQNYAVFYICLKWIKHCVLINYQNVFFFFCLWWSQWYY